MNNKENINSKQINSGNKTMLFRKPSTKDGANIWRLAKESKLLDLNSPYCYIMLCDLFKGTCAVAELDEEIVGFVSAFRIVERPATLFIWQITVAESYRGKGIGLSLLQQICMREENSKIQIVETTISPSNVPSLSLFRKFAENMESRCEELTGYPAHLFPGSGHEDEKLFRIILEAEIYSPPVI
ncbi:diaminobutyrate acetyltransferase [Paenibacillus pabuli]|uniref:L-2,4-diaminobutyric acid acetyltransferase n=1 Tax=Paenibacillus pabuli TaxID=1472 RepID=A0ABX9BES5_9BACL|nr:diaminobutyrate acetyltransferase [Paenibacillus pabuli]RAI89557.1 diaminobutyrate acetyltransferase [Paenibacillus pabuli]